LETPPHGMMKLLLQTLLGAALAALFLLPAQAQDPAPEKQPEGKQAKKGSQKGGRGSKQVAAKKLRQREKEREREVLAHFEICDLDASGWVSYREAEVTLGIEKSEFRLYDENQDGRISPLEFRDRYQTILGLLGAVRPPVRPDSGIEVVEPEEGVLEEPEDPRGSAGEPAVIIPEVFPSPRDLLEIYDRDRNGGLAESELEALFRDIGGVLSADVVARQMDPDLSGELELSELGPLSMLVSRRLPEPVTGRVASEVPVLHELYSITLPRKQPIGAPPAPPRILGPVTQFRRLDLWNDGFIDADDLRQLLSPARVNVRPTAIVAALDRDGDGRLDQSEFLACLGAE
jgi:Ca2+-binding EF-hand superfamily protein